MQLSPLLSCLNNHYVIIKTSEVEYKYMCHKLRHANRTGDFNRRLGSNTFTLASISNTFQSLPGQISLRNSAYTLLKEITKYTGMVKACLFSLQISSRISQIISPQNILLSNAVNILCKEDSRTSFQGHLNNILQRTWILCRGNYKKISESWTIKLSIKELIL